MREKIMRNFSASLLFLLTLALSACAKQQHLPPAPAHTQWQVAERRFTENNSAKTAYQLDLRYPEIISHPDTASTRQINQWIYTSLQEAVAAFKKHLPKGPPDYADYPAQLTSNRFRLRYTATLLKPGGHTLISLRFETTTHYAGEFTDLHHLAVMNYDLQDGTLLTLASLFKPDAPYLEALANQCQNTLRKRFTQGMPWMPWDMESNQPLAKNFQIWNLERKGLVVTFQEYQVTPYSSKPQRILLPYTRLRPLLSPASPVAIYAAL